MNDHPPSSLLAKCWADRIRLIAIENMKGAFGNEGALRFSKAFQGSSARCSSRSCTGRQRKFNCKRAAFSWSSAVIDRAAMFIDDLQRVRESQARAVSLRGKERHNRLRASSSL